MSYDKLAKSSRLEGRVSLSIVHPKVQILMLLVAIPLSQKPPSATCFTTCEIILSMTEKLVTYY